MNKEERHLFILKNLEIKDKVLVTELAKQFHVTPETIRRDLAELEMNEQLTRIHGGAVAFIPSQKEMMYEKKMSLYIEEKQKIAKQAARYIEHGDTIAVDIGTTTVHLADMIEDVQSLTVVTNSLSAANRFNLALEEQRMTGEIFVLPGFTNPYQAAVKGTSTVQLLRRFKFNRAFISCGGLTSDAVYDFDMDESLVSEMMIQRSNESILLTDSSKINKEAKFEISPLSNISTIICDEAKPVDWNNTESNWKVVD